MHLSLDRIPDYQNWLHSRQLRSDGTLKSTYFAVIERENKTDYPSKYKFVNSDRYLERIITQDQDALSRKYRIKFVYCLRYKQNTEVDIEVYDPTGNNLLAVHKIAKVIAKKNQIKLVYSASLNLASILSPYGISSSVVRKHCLQLIDDLEAVIDSPRVNTDKVDNVFLTDYHQKNRKRSKKSNRKKQHVPKKRDRSYQIEIR